MRTLRNVGTPLLSVATALSVLTACAGNPPAAATREAASGAAGTPTDTAPSSDTPACSSNTMKASLDSPAGSPAGGQQTFTLRYTNISEIPCVTSGYPGATLRGPDWSDLGGEFQLPRSTIRAPHTLVVSPGSSAIADLTVLATSPGDTAGWLPTELLTIAPDDTVVISVPWPSSTPVLRQDGATHPGSYIGVLRAG